ncbi:hypothetical protein MJO29_014047 [Puccinia striiformis f. sp. tritici]|nr:hypothetical protein MJO29_014047 [Puccinia striiformis f. sp. tritici]
MQRTESAVAHRVSRFSKRIFIWTINKSCREHGSHLELAVVVPLDFKRNSILYRIASNKRKFYLSTNVIDLGTGMEEGSPTFGGRPTWLGKLEDDRQGHERLELIVKRIKDALQTVVKSKSGSADGWCSKDWVVKFIKEEEARGEFCSGRLRCVREAVAGIM